MLNFTDNPGGYVDRGKPGSVFPFPFWSSLFSCDPSDLAGREFPSLAGSRGLKEVSSHHVEVRGDLLAISPPRPPF